MTIDTGYGFADDSCTLIGGQNLNQRMNRTQKVIDDLVFWGHSCEPKFNLDKTVCIIFTKAKTITDLPNKLTVSEKSVDFSYSTKYLGVTLDSKLLWSIHTHKASQKAKAYFFMILNNVKTRFGPKPFLVKWINTAIVRPRLLHGFFTWGPKVIRTNLEKELQGINNLACKMKHQLGIPHLGNHLKYYTI